jgi:flagellar basal-body rod protein FlgG
MTQSLHQLTASMVNQLNRVDVISNNIANANTNAFKEDSLVEGSFNSYLSRKQEAEEPIDKESLVMNTMPKIDGNYISQDMGSIVETGNRLDFALNQNDMFFKIKNKNGEISYTRDGSFKILDNKLVTQNGNNVLDNQNNEIVVENENFKNKISLVTIDFKNLAKVGDNNYKVKNNEDLLVVENNENYLLQGAIEKSNVNSIKSMVSLIEAQRKFEQSQKAITSIDAINGKVIESIGNGR